MFKAKDLIKADFFLNPEKYGYKSNFPYCIDTIWKKVIKGDIPEFEEPKHKILNNQAHDFCSDARKFLKQYVNKWYDITK